VEAPKYYGDANDWVGKYVASSSLPELNAYVGTVKVLKKSKCQRREVSKDIFEWL